MMPWTRSDTSIMATSSSVKTRPCNLFIIWQTPITYPSLSMIGTQRRFFNSKRSSGVDINWKAKIEWETNVETRMSLRVMQDVHCCRFHSDWPFLSSLPRDRRFLRNENVQESRSWNVWGEWSEMIVSFALRCYTKFFAVDHIESFGEMNFLHKESIGAHSRISNGFKPRIDSVLHWIVRRCKHSIERIA